jgi:hypothetical protein
METQPGLVVLLGSGETAPNIRKVYHWLFEQIATDIHIGILETPAGFEPNSAKVAQEMADFMTKRLKNFRPDISIVPARTRGTDFSPDDPDIVSPLLQTNVIMMGPGSPTYAARQLRDSVAWHTLVARHRLGASLIFASATTIASGVYALPVYEIYKVGQDLHWQTGLDFFGSFGLSLIFIPHWNNKDGGEDLDTSHCYIGTDRYDQLVAMLPDNPTIVGIDEHTALIVDPVTGCCRVMGVGQVHVVQEKQKKNFPGGTTFALSELGPFSLPQLSQGLPQEVWQRVSQAYREREEASEDSPLTPPNKVMDLVKKRATARASQNWAIADSLRDEIEALGWRVLDTPDGAVLETVS